MIGRVWIAVALMGVAAGVMGLRAGRGAANLTEGEVIAAYAARYVAESGGAGHPRDCAAAPDDRPEVWMVIVCDGGARRSVWAVGRGGRELAGVLPDA